jgi:hypothetical protein
MWPGGPWAAPVHEARALILRKHAMEASAGSLLLGAKPLV